MAISPTPEIPEQIKNLNNRMTSLAEFINESITEIHNSLTTGFDTMANRFNNVDTNVSNIKNDTTSIKSDTTTIKALIEALTSGGIHAVKRVQRGEVTIDGNSSNATVNLTYPVDVNKCFVILEGSGYYKSYPNSASACRYGYNKDPRYELTSTVITITASSSDVDRDEDPETYIQWQIIEFN